MSSSRTVTSSAAMFFALVTAGSAQAEQPKTPSIMVVARDDGPPAGPASFALVLRTLGALDAIGGTAVFHPKQVRAVMETHGDRFASLSPKKKLEAVGPLLGAEWAVSVGFAALRPKVQVSLEVASLKGGASSSKQLEGSTLIAALDQIPAALADLLKATHALDAAAIAPGAKIAPLTSDEDAMMRYAECAETLNRQPIGIREPVLVDPQKLTHAIALCDAAIARDKNFYDAKAALGLAWALKEDRERAERWLKDAKAAPILLTDYAIAKFWIVSRFYDRGRALEALEESIAKSPGFLLARGYLGDALTILERYDDALKVFSDYLELVPNQPWVMARLGLVNSKKKELGHAMEWTKKALTISPDDSELLLEMASRDVDAKNFKEAEDVLHKILALGNARGEVHLRLGYVYLETNRLGPAEKELERAIEQAAKVLEWRTRGRARYDLAKMWMRAEVPERALQQLKLALDEGFRDWKKIDADPDLKPLMNDPKFRSLRGGNPTRSYLPKYASPFKLDLETAEIAPVEAREQKTETVVFKF